MMDEIFTVMVIGSDGLKNVNQTFYINFTNEEPTINKALPSLQE